jgi:hypothetical protein
VSGRRIRLFPTPCRLYPHLECTSGCADDECALAPDMNADVPADEPLHDGRVPNGDDGVPLFDDDEPDVYGSPLERWWLDDSHDLAAQTVAKMHEYGSNDLCEIGHMFWRLAGRHRDQPLSDVEAAELGCIFYLQGKMARVLSALQRGAWASDDTWLDLEVYSKMVRATRAGVWEIQES